MTCKKYRSSSLLSNLWVLWLVCLFPALCWCVPLNAVLGPLWTNLLRSAYWIRETEEAKQLLVEEPCAEVLCARAMSFVGRLGSILAMKTQIVCCCCWHNRFVTDLFNLHLSSLKTLNVLHHLSFMLYNPQVIVVWSSHKHCCLAICGRGKFQVYSWIFVTATFKRIGKYGIDLARVDCNACTTKSSI